MGFFSPKKNNRELSASVIFQPLLIPSVITHSFQKKKTKRMIQTVQS